MSDHPAFLQHLRAQPSDDTARGAYADWLDEHGESEAATNQHLAVALRAVLSDSDDDAPRERYAEVCRQRGRLSRAEFIELQLKLAKTDPNGYATPTPTRGPALVRAMMSIDNPLHGYLRQREFELLAGCDPTTNWMAWCWAEDKLEDGIPCRAGSKGGVWSPPSPPSLATTDYPTGVVWVPTEGGRVGQEFTRGFVSRVTMSAEDWVRHADSIAWRPGWQSPCPRKACHGGRVMENQWTSKKCVVCKGTGCVPKPFVATAHPVTHVTLTSWPRGLVPEGVPPRELAMRMLLEWFSERWPGITLELRDI